MTEQQRIDNLTGFGYTPREAAFLSLAALHSGYFVRRQYCSFVSCSKGWVDEAFTAKLLELRHAKEVVLRSRRRFYNIHSKQLFDALGEIDNRNRRRHETQTIKARLMGLEYVIGRPEVRWFPTENERIALFTEELGVDREHLPAWRYESRNGNGTTLRWFVDKPPIFIRPDDPTVHFCFADPGHHTADSFASFLGNYRPLFARLQRFEVIYIALGPGGVERARQTFERLISPSKARPEDPLVGALAEYFRDRREHETAGLAAFDQKRLNRYRHARKEFAGARFDRLFENWSGAGERVIQNEVSPESSPDLRARGGFTAHICPQRFDLLGSVLSSNSGAKRQNPLVHGGFGGGF